jgi:hypothetical protein
MQTRRWWLVRGPCSGIGMRRSTSSTDFATDKQLRCILRSAIAQVDLDGGLTAELQKADQ